MQQQLKTSTQVLDIQEALILVKEMGSHSSLIKSIHATVDSWRLMFQKPLEDICWVDVLPVDIVGRLIKWSLKIGVPVCRVYTDIFYSTYIHTPINTILIYTYLISQSIFISIYTTYSIEDVSYLCQAFQQKCSIPQHEIHNWPMPMSLGQVPIFISSLNPNGFQRHPHFHGCSQDPVM